MIQCKDPNISFEYKLRS